jgi:hypothetical protein
MPIKRNGFYNDPAMAQAAANLSSMFEPPSGSDSAGYARARADDLQTVQRQAIWDYMQDPNADRELLDRAGVFSDLFDPSNSYYSVDTGAATLRANNAADNARLVETNRLDNLAKLYGEGYGNVGRDEIQPAMGLDVLGQFGGTAAVPEFAGPTSPLSVFS